MWVCACERVTAWKCECLCNVCETVWVLYWLWTIVGKWQSPLNGQGWEIWLEITMYPNRRVASRQLMTAHEATRVTADNCAWWGFHPKLWFWQNSQWNSNAIIFLNGWEMLLLLVCLVLIKETDTCPYNQAAARLVSATPTSAPHS